MFTMDFAGKNYQVKYGESGFEVKPNSKDLKIVLETTKDIIAPTVFFFDDNAIEHYVALELGIDVPLVIEPTENGLIY